MRAGRFSRREALSLTERICRDAFALRGKATEATTFTYGRQKCGAGSPHLGWETQYATESSAYVLRFDAEAGDLVFARGLDRESDGTAPQQSAETQEEISASVAEAAARRYLTGTAKILYSEDGVPEITIDYVRINPAPNRQWEISCFCRRKNARISHYRLWLNRHDATIEDFLLASEK